LVRTPPHTLGKKKNKKGKNNEVKENNKNIAPEKIKSQAVLNFSGVAKEWCEENTAILFQKLTDTEDNYFFIEKEILLEDQRSYDAICYELIETYGLAVSTTINENGIRCKIRE